jgi:hypothetical protein
VPFVGMYLTALVHAADQFKDYVLIPEDEKRRQSGEAVRGEIPSEPGTPTQTFSPTMGAASTMSGRTNSKRMLLNFTKRHKQADIIGAMLKFQLWPYEVMPIPGETTTGRMDSPPPGTHLSPSTSTSPSTATTSAIHLTNTSATMSLYPYTPSSASASIPLYASAGGVAWIQEQLSRAARVTLGSDWAYERSMRLHDEETGWLGVRDILGDSGF